jgi:actin-like ATPase involved in cell morphogenesis
VADDPLFCVALGAGKILDEIDLWKKVATPI